MLSGSEDGPGVWLCVRRQPAWHRVRFSPVDLGLQVLLWRREMGSAWSGVLPGEFKGRTGRGMVDAFQRGVQEPTRGHQLRPDQQTLGCCLSWERSQALSPLPLALCIQGCQPLPVPPAETCNSQS